MTEVVICCGVGGVGKTTTAAAVAVGLARGGKRVVVLTIDPAKRLADALALKRLDNHPRPVPLREAEGSLDALMLDRKGTWDDIVRRFSPSKEAADRLLANRYYHAVSERLTGSHEYMAVEKLYHLVEDGRWDVVVVDTPPAQHALDFFRAPDRVRRILDRSVMKLIMDSGSAGFWGFATNRANKVVKRLAGDRVIADISEFFRLFSGLSGGFRERSESVRQLLVSERTAYFLVASAAAPERSDILDFVDTLRERGMRFHGFLVNRVAEAPPLDDLTLSDLPDAPRDVERAAWEAWRLSLLSLLSGARHTASRHQADARELARRGGGAPVWLIPDLGTAVRSLEGLEKLATYLPPNPPAME